MPGLTTAAKPTHWGGLRAPIPARCVEPSRRCDLTRSPAPTCGLPRYQSLTTSPAAFRDGPRPHVTSHDLARRAAISRDLLSPRATSRRAQDYECCDLSTCHALCDDLYTVTNAVRLCKEGCTWMHDNGGDVCTPQMVPPPPAPPP